MDSGHSSSHGSDTASCIYFVQSPRIFAYWFDNRVRKTEENCKYLAAATWAMATIQMAGKGIEPRTHDSYDVFTERIDASSA
jgi:hypothetical protein